MTDLISYIQNKTKLSWTEAETSAITLLESGFHPAHVFFYEKEKTNNLPYWKIDLFESLLRDFQALKDKKTKYVVQITDHSPHIEKKEELLKKIESCLDIRDLEEIFRPFKKRHKTKASIAREAGLAELAQYIKKVSLKEEPWEEQQLESLAKKYIHPSLGFISFDVVLQGVKDIFIDQWMKDSNLRKEIKTRFVSKSEVFCTRGDKFKEGTSEKFLKFKQPVHHLLNSKNHYKFPPVKKAWEDSQIKVQFDIQVQDIFDQFLTETCPCEAPEIKELLRQAAHKAFHIHLIPAVCQELVADIMQVSESEAIRRLKRDYQTLLLAPALGAQALIAVYSEEHSFKMMLLSDKGICISESEIKYDSTEAHSSLTTWIQEISKNIELGAIGIGISSFARKAKKHIEKSIEDSKIKVPVTYVETRGLTSFLKSQKEPEAKNPCISIGRRLQDPLIELSKYPPKSLLDVPNYVTSEKLLIELQKTQTYCHYHVGIDLNHHNDTQLSCVQNLTEENQKQIQDFVITQGAFTEKQQLSEKLGFNRSLLEATSGVLCVKSSPSLLDRTRIPLTKFTAVKDMLKEYKIAFDETRDEVFKPILKDEKWSKVFGKHFLNFIVLELKKPHGTRKAYRFFDYDSSVEKMEDLVVGHTYWGLVSKFTSFGAFIDLGLGSQEALIHLTEMANDFTPDPRQVLQLGQWVKVKLIKLDKDKKLISLSLKQVTLGAPKSLRAKPNFKPKSQNFKKDDRDSRPKRDFKKRPPKTPFNNAFDALKSLK